MSSTSTSTYDDRLSVFDAAQSIQEIEILIKKDLIPTPMNLIHAFYNNPDDAEKLDLYLKYVNLDEITQGTTILHKMCKHIDFQEERMIKSILFLLKHGANALIKNDDGQTALDELRTNYNSTKQNKRNTQIKNFIRHVEQLIFGKDYISFPNEIKKWLCKSCSSDNLFVDIICSNCGNERIVDLSQFESLINIGEISNILIEFVDCIALNSLIELKILTTKHIQFDKKKYCKEMEDRIIKIHSDLPVDNNNDFRIRTVTISTKDDMNMNMNQIFEAVLEGDDDIISIMEEWKNENGNQNKTNLEICRDKLGINNFSDRYPLNLEFNLNDEKCVKMILLSVMMNGVDDLYELEDYFGEKETNNKFNFKSLIAVWCLILFKQDLLNIYKNYQFALPKNVKNKFPDSVYYNAELEERCSICVHSMKCGDIKKWTNIKNKVNTKDVNECLENMYFGQLVNNDFMVYNEQYEINPNILNDISNKVLLETYVKDIIESWFCFDAKFMRQNHSFQSDIFYNYFYGILSSEKGEEDESYVIELVEYVISYYFDATD
eukprot:309464_1